MNEQKALKELIRLRNEGEYLDYPLFQYEMLQNIFRTVQPKRVLLLGGGTALDFFVANTATDHGCDCTYFDMNSEWRGIDYNATHTKYRTLFNHTNEFDVKFARVQLYSSFGGPDLSYYDIIIDSTPQNLDRSDLIKFNGVYIKNHYRQIHQWPHMLEIGQQIPMQAATFHSCIYARNHFPITKPAFFKTRSPSCSLAGGLVFYPPEAGKLEYDID